MTTRWLFLTPLAFVLSALHGATEVKTEAHNDSGDSSLAKPLAKWTFDDALVGTWLGKPTIEAQGPQAPTYPGFKKDNKAAYFSGKNSAITIKESDLPGVNLRFKQGDALTLEAWVNVDTLDDGKYVYLIGKGRNKRAEFQAENQNYALRLKAEGGEAKVCFLFRSESSKVDGSKDYHRWVSSEGFAPGSGWHHVAVSYTFGKSASMVGYVDGKPQKGTWDMAGKSDKPPVNDADDLMIGTGNGGGANNTLKGWLDEVAIYREMLPAALIAQRYQFVPPAPVVDAKKLPKGKVRVEICEDGVAEKNAWPAISPKATESYEEDAFGLFELPHKYVDTGVRGDRHNPFLLRAASVVKLPAGKHRLLLRARGASHLHIDGKQVLLTGYPTGDGGGHGHVQEHDKYLNLGPDFRFVPPGNREAWCEFESKGGEHLFVLEEMVGGIQGKSKNRPEVGETVVAISYAGTETWQMVTPKERQIAYNDEGWTAYVKERTPLLDQLNAKHRNEQRALNAAYWDKRRKVAKDWLAKSGEVNVPELVKGYPANNEIDRFIAAKISSVAEQNKASHEGTVDFFRDIQPILETKCLDCHQGAKVKGGLKLDSLTGAEKGGKSDGPAVSPGKPDESALLKRIVSKDEDEVMPPKGEHLSEAQVTLMTKWIHEGAHWPEMKAENMTLTATADDLTFLRRAFLDTVGVPPSLEEIEKFTKEGKLNRTAVIDALLKDSRWADQWMGYWQDVLAENPNILNPTLNNTGPFRWWLYESLLDDKPMDLFVTELLRMRGSERLGGPAGFGVASQNDVPMAAKGTIVSTAFLVVEMKCARCHDSPSHKSKQEELFSLAAMLSTKPVEVPLTSSVSMDKIGGGGRKPLIEVTLKPGTKVEPKWPFAEFCPEAIATKIAEDAKDSRDRLAALVTAPQNERFAQVIANRVWARLMGRGIVEPVADWEKGKPTHPELLKWLGREFVRSGYSMKHLAKIIMNSDAYQRAIDQKLHSPSPLYVAPSPRRLNAEQIVDSLFAATGKPFTVEEVSLDIDSRRDMANSISLGQARRSWMLTSTSNERDRPSLALPRIQAVTDVLGAFGWRGSRQDATSIRESAPNALQPAILSNGTMSIWLTRLSDDHGITQLALKEQTPEQFVDALFLKLLTRKPNADERSRYVEHLSAGFDKRIQAPSVQTMSPSTGERRPTKYVSWSNHLDPEATVVRQEQELAARRGDEPTQRLNPEWRGHLEDVLWALLNSPEWIYCP